jgi:hypothetical protein
MLILSSTNASPKPFVWTKSADAILANSTDALYQISDV